jgi:hypothetical protein
VPVPARRELTELSTTELTDFFAIREEAAAE